MKNFASWTFASLALVASVASGCGDDSPTGGGGAGGGPDGGGTTEGGSPSTGGSNIGGGIPEDCGSIEEITQNGASVLFSTGGVGFEFSPELGLSEPEVITVAGNPDSMGPIPTGTRDLSPDGLVLSTASVDAVVDLINAPPTAADGRLFVAIAGRVSVDATPEAATQFKGRLTGTLTDVVYIELGDDFEPIPEGDCLFLAEGTFEAADYVTDCDAPTDVTTTPSGGACLADFVNIGHECNPITNDGCAVDEICDWGGVFRCYPVEGTEVGLCEACHGVDGPPCQVGMTCDNDQTDGQCYRYCCTDEDCGPSGTCIAYSFAPTGVGVCMSN